MINLQLSEQEALAMRNLLDLAVKAGGMSVAMAALTLDQKILTAARAVQQPPMGNGKPADVGSSLQPV